MYQAYENSSNPSKTLMVSVKDVKLTPWFTIEWEGNKWCISLEVGYQFSKSSSQNTKITFLRHIPKELKTCLKNNMYMSIQGNIICNSPKLKLSHISTNR